MRKKIEGKTITEKYIEKAICYYGKSAYDYSLVDYDNAKTRIKIICKIHGEFETYPSNFLNGYGTCGQCKIENRRKEKLKIFLDKIKDAHGDRYDYSKITSFRSVDHPIEVICKEHGSFFPTPYSFLKGTECPKCSIKRQAKNKIKTTEQFIKDCKKIHGNKYDYSKTEYKSVFERLIITCKEHGDFEQTADAHLHGAGCQICGGARSYSEKELANWIKSLGFQIITNKQYQNKDKTKRFEADITIPYKNLIIEFNGLEFHHTHGNNYQEKNLFHIDKYYHRDKSKHFNDLGYDVIHIWEHEWKSKQEIVKDIIMNRLGLSRNKKIYARKTIVKEIQYNEFKEIMEFSHIQGVSSANKYYGLYSENLLVAAMSFSKTNQGNEEFELKRYVNLLGYNIIGGASKLFKFFMKENNYPSVKSFSMDRLFNGRMYEKLGFIKIKKTPPTYFYHKGYQIINRRSAQKRYIKDLIGEHKFDENKTEVEMMNEAGYFQIFDTGLTHWSYNTEI